MKRVANGLHKYGISTSVDDFGMGYSSLNLIRDVPWDMLKVDKSFLPETEDSHDDNTKKDVLLKHVIEMAQGYYFDKPFPVGVFKERLERK